MFKRILYSIWTFSLQKGWNWITGRTKVDEQIAQTYFDLVVAIEDYRSRIDRMKEELEDVKKATAEVKNQFKDVITASKTPTKRRGRPKKTE